MILAYARVSTADQAAGDRISITEQLARCKAIAELRGMIGKFDFATFIDRAVSGSVPLIDRPGGRDMLSHANRGDFIVASKLDRIFRSAADALTMIDDLKRKGIGLIISDMGVDPVGESPATQMFFGMLSLVAQFERQRIHERITEGKVAKRARGGHVGGLVPFGYKRIGQGRDAILARCDKEQAHIRRCRALSSECERSIKQIATIMEREGMLGRDGKQYNPMAIYRMLHPKRKHGPDLAINHQAGVAISG